MASCRVGLLSGSFPSLVVVLVVVVVSGVVYRVRSKQKELVSIHVRQGAYELQNYDVPM